MTGYKIIRAVKTRSAHITVPPHIAQVVPEEVRFECELVEEGLLYRPIKTTTAGGLPSWVASS